MNKLSSSTPCAICPRRCNAVRTFSSDKKAEGFCKAPEELVISRAGLHRWEEPVISGTRGSGTVFFSGCNLHCVYCQNHEISSRCTGKKVSQEGLRKLFYRLIERGAHNINLVTGGHYVEQIAPVLEEKFPVPIVYNSNGYELPETLKLLENKVDIYLPDLKYKDNDLAKRYSHAPDYFERACAAIDEMYRQVGDFEFFPDGMLKKGVIIRHLILPNQLENTLKVIEYVAKRYKAGQVLFSLMRQYLPCGAVDEKNYPELNRRISDFEYEIAESALFDSGIEDGFVQDAESAEKEFIPDFENGGSDADAVSLDDLE